MNSFYMGSIFFILYVWLLYPLILKVFTYFIKRDAYTQSLQKFTVSVIIASQNEERNLLSRIDNIYDSNYPFELIEVLIASDGSTDSSREVCESLREKYPSLYFLDFMPQQGRSNVHNLAVKRSCGDILIFTDAETAFKADTIENLVLPFSDKNVGFVSGKLYYNNLSVNRITKSFGIYWKYEQLLRKFENTLGLYMLGTGACSAVRRELYRPISLVDDMDLVTPLDAILQGYKCTYQEKSIAFDVTPDSNKREFNARVRMVSKDIRGIFTRWGLRGLIKHPIYTWVIFSHKVARWLTPFAFIGLFLGTLITESNLLVEALLVCQFIFYTLGVAGYLKLPIPFSGVIFSFILANIGFLVGIYRAVAGQTPKSYKPISQVK